MKRKKRDALVQLVTDAIRADRNLRLARDGDTEMRDALWFAFNDLPNTDPLDACQLSSKVIDNLRKGE